MVAAILSGRRYLSLKQTIGKFRDSFVPSTLTLDEDGITLANSQSKTLRMRWDQVQFIRIFKECICIMAKEQNGFIMSVDIRYQNQILSYVKEEHPEVMLIESKR